MFEREYWAGPLGARRFGAVLSWLFCGLTLALTNYVSVPWIDEVGTSDTAVNLALNGQWISHCWQYSYNLLHLFLLTGWLKIFGVSHFSVCALNVILAGMACHALLRIFYSRHWNLSLTVTALFCVLFWGGFRFSTIITNGRIDILALLCTVFLVNEITQKQCRPMRVLLWSFLSMAAAVYQMPVVVLFAFLCRLLQGDRPMRGAQFKLPLLVILGAGVAFVGACAVYLTQHQLLKFVYTYFSFNATLAGARISFAKRVWDAYAYDISFVILWVIAMMLAWRAHQLRPLARFFAFILLIPFLQVCSGRCAEYYSWVSYLPVIVMLAYCAGLTVHGIYVRCLLAVGVVMAVAVMCTRYQQVAPARTVVHDYEAFAAKVGDLNGRQDLVIPSDLGYYKMLGRGRFVWRLDLSGGPSPREKFLRFVNARASSEAERQKFIRLYERIQVDQPAMPTNSAFFVIDTRAKQDFAHGHDFRLRYEDGPFRLYESHVHMK